MRIWEDLQTEGTVTELGSFTLSQTSKPQGRDATERTSSRRHPDKASRRASPNTRNALYHSARAPESQHSRLGAATECAGSLKAVAGGAPLGGDFAHKPVSSWMVAVAAAGSPGRWEGWGQQRPWGQAGTCISPWGCSPADLEQWLCPRREQWRTKVVALLRIASIQ